MNKFIKGCNIDRVLRSLVIILLVICSITCVTLSYQVGRLASYFNMQNNSEDIEQAANIMNEIKDLYDNNYIGVERENADSISTVDGVLSAYAYSLGDKYGFYMSPENSKEEESKRREELVGIGIEVVYEQDKGYYVTKAYKGSPAEKAGVSKGDYIISADGIKVTEVGPTEFLNLIKGKPGTEVSLGILKASEADKLGDNWVSNKIEDESIQSGNDTSEGTGADTVIIDESHLESESMVRGEVQMASVSFEVLKAGEYNLDKDIGYLKIDSFTEYTDEEFKEAIESLNSQGIYKYLVDLRGNSGGAAPSVIEMLDYCLPEGLIVEFKAKNEKENKVYNSDKQEIQGDFVILVDSGTASASELFTKALKDYNKAVVVGETTYGKGTVLSTYMLSNGGTITLSTAKYYTISGDEIEGVGIKPDYEVILSPEDKNELYKLSRDADEQFMKAIEVINTEQ